MGDFMKKLIISLTAATALISTAPAIAEGHTAYDWSGWYAGIFASHGWGSMDMDPIHFTNLATPIDNDGFVAGILGGYRMQQPNNVVYGVQVAVPLLSEKGGATHLAGALGVQTVETNFGVIVTGQVGRAYGRWLPLVTAGAGMVSVTSTTATSNITKVHPLITVGVGANFAVTENVAVGARYNFVKVMRETHQNAFNACCNPEFGMDIHTLGAVLEFKLPVGN